MLKTLAEVDKAMFAPLVLEAVKELARMTEGENVQYYEVRALILGIGRKAHHELPRELQVLVLPDSRLLADQAALERVAQGLENAYVMLM